MKQSYSQLQSIRAYYDFPDVDVDRYTIGGRKRQVLVAARELNVGLLDPKAQNWVNTHLVYTHGFGLVMSPVNEADSRGLPEFVIGDIPPAVSSELATGVAAKDLEIKQPRIYFGEDTDPYVIVDTGKDEFDYPQGERNAYYQYKGASGPEIGSPLRRLAWAIRLGSSQVFFSGYLKPDSRVLMHRDVMTRVETLAPWLRYEDDPYTTIVDGRIVWIVDAYTSSTRYPYAERLEDGTNYLRNSVKVTVDAFTGETTFYAFDPDDPVLKAWRGVFPTLVVDGDKIPDAVREHFRYPVGLFSAQAEIYRTYHMTDVNVFYNKEDQWQIPGERKGQTMAALLRAAASAGGDRRALLPHAALHAAQQGQHERLDRGIERPDQLRRAHRLQLPQRARHPRPRAGLGPHQPGLRDLAAALALEPAREQGALRQHARDSDQGVDRLHPAAVPAGRGDRDSRAHARHRRLRRQGRHGEGPGVRAAQGLRRGACRDDRDARRRAAARRPTADLASARTLYEQAIAAQKAGDWAEYGRLIKQLGEVLARLAAEEGTRTP